MIIDNTPSANNSPRQVTCPPGEMNITNIALSSTGNVLYSAAGNSVRIWDLRKSVYVVQCFALSPKCAQYPDLYKLWYQFDVNRAFCNFCVLCPIDDISTQQVTATVEHHGANCVPENTLWRILGSFSPTFGLEVTELEMSTNAIASWGLKDRPVVYSADACEICCMKLQVGG